jgi:hypothetical protein
MVIAAHLDPEPQPPPRRRWLGWALMALIPFAGLGLFFFHVIVYTGAAGGCGGG